MNKFYLSSFICVHVHFRGLHGPEFGPKPVGWAGKTEINLPMGRTDKCKTSNLAYRADKTKMKFSKWLMKK